MLAVVIEHATSRRCWQYPRWLARRRRAGNDSRSGLRRLHVRRVRYVHREFCHAGDRNRVETHSRLQRGSGVIRNVGDVHWRHDLGPNRRSLRTKGGILWHCARLQFAKRWDRALCQHNTVCDLAFSFRIIPGWHVAGRFRDGCRTSRSSASRAIGSAASRLLAGRLFLAAIASFVLVPRFGWQSLFLAGALPAALAPFVIRRLPESPRWLASRGKKEKAAAALVLLGANEQQVKTLDESKAQIQGVPLKVLLRPPYLRRLFITTSVLFFGFFGYYGFVLWLPSILVLHFKMRLAQAFGYTILVGSFAILGKITALVTIDRFGRKQLFYVGFGMAAIVSLIFGLLKQPLHLLAGACALSFFLEEAAAGCVVLPTELFPSQVRGTANSWSSAAGKLAAALSPIVFGFFMARHEYYEIFATMAVFFGVACMIIFALGTEAKGKGWHEAGAS